MIVRFIALILLGYMIGFGVFAVALPQPAEGGRTDAIVVPTGSAGRIERGLAVLESGGAPAMLVTGVDREVTRPEFAAQYSVPEKTMECCVTLGFNAVDTRSNAAETAAWVSRHGYRSVRLVTADWHMRRAEGELKAALPSGVTIMRDAVHTTPSLRNLFLEYNKLIASYLARLIDI
ncbi:YdcF family protein [Tsuneonella suprasediminis]|uniref:YdcF family protein n=1 Tax=Tsuneonella suprasediminis TaxID=2306996 RepID=A0A419R5T3_9SPHN|nr:YdcF family protein [Tsuneonella suprasediminis]RJX71273.1 YdcF family protein [Tsuneonella suprasediminis]